MVEVTKEMCKEIFREWLELLEKLEAGGEEADRKEAGGEEADREEAGGEEADREEAGGEEAGGEEADREEADREEAGGEEAGGEEADREEAGGEEAGGEEAGGEEEDYKKEFARNIIDVGNMFALSYFNNHQYIKSKMCYELVQKQLKRILGPKHPDTLKVSLNIGRVLGRLGEIEEALKKLDEVDDSLLHQNNLGVDLLEKGVYPLALYAFTEVHRKASETLGPDHMETLIYQHNKARPLNAEGKFQETLDILEDVYKLREEKLGPAHVLTLTTLRDIGMCLQNLKRPQDSFDRLEKAYAKASEQLKPDDPQMFLIQTDKAFLFSEEGRYEDAHEIYKEMLDVQSKDPTNISYLHTKANIGDLWMKQGWYDKALEEYMAVHHTLIDINAEKCRVIDVRNRIADALAAQGKYKEALKMYEGVFRTRKHILGLADYRTLSAQYDIGHMHMKMRNYDKALEELKEVSTRKIELLGLKEVDIKHTRMLTAEIYAKQKKYKEAMKVYEEIYKIYEKVGFSAGIMTILTNIASMLCLMGKYEDALEKYKEITKLRETHPDWVDTLGADQDIVCILWRDGMDEDLLSNYVKFYDKSKEILGENHIITIDILNTIAESYASGKEHVKAIEAFDKIYKFYGAQTDEGTNHHLALLNRSCVARLYYRESDFDKALQMYEELYDALRKDSNEVDPDVVDVKSNIDIVKKAKEKALETSMETNGSNTEVNVEAKAELDDETLKDPIEEDTKMDIEEKENVVLNA